MTYKLLGRSIANYAVPVWSTNTSELNISKIQPAQNEALRIITGSHKMSSIDHFHKEPSFCAISGTVSGNRECLSPHHQDGSSNRVTTASQQQERQTSGTSHLICQHNNRQYEG